MSDYTTTNLRLPVAAYDELRYQARRRGTSIATLVREAVAQYLGHAGAPDPIGGDPVDALIGAIDSDGPTDSSLNHGPCTKNGTSTTFARPHFCAKIWRRASS
jgi:hypothetical protein